MPAASVRSSYGTSRQRPPRGDRGPDGVGPVPGPRSHRGQDVRRRGRDVADHTQVDRPVHPDRVRLEVDLHHPRGRTEQRAVPGRPHVQRAAPADHQVRVPDQLDGQRRGEPAGDAERELVAHEQSVGDGRRREQGAGRRAERPQLTAGPACAATGDEHRALRGRDQGGQLVDRSGRRPDRRQHGNRRQRGVRDGGGLHVERQVQHHRAPLLDGRPVGPDDVRGRRFGRVHPVRDRADGRDQRVLVDAEVRADGGRAGLGGEHEQRGAALRGLGDAGHGVGQPAALVHRQHRGAAGRPRPRVGHRRGAALVPGRDERDTGGTQRVRDVEVAAAHDAERVPDAEPGQCRADELRDGHLSTSASTRAGLPDPETIGSGPAITTAPVAGSRARFCSWVSPYLPAPST